MSSTIPTAAPSAPARRPPLPSLTGLRFLAALLVFFFHTSLANSPIPPNAPINPFANRSLAAWDELVFSKAGYVGVSFFFVLSGFVLTWASKPNEPATAFLRRRLVKIFPNHLAVWAVAMVLFAGAVTEPSAWLPNLFLIHTFFPQPAINLSVSPPTWSLCSELLFYLSFPLLIRLFHRTAGKRLWAWSAVMVAGMVGIQLLAQFCIPATPKSAITPISDLQFWFGYLFPPSRIFEFALGILLARIVMTGQWPRTLGIIPSTILMVLGYALALVLPFQYGFNVATIIPVSALIGAVAQADAEGRRTRLRSRVMVWLGEVSFGFYLCQGIMIFYLRKLMGDAQFGIPAGIAVVIGFFCTALLGGWLLHTFVEQPAMRRWSRSRKSRPQVPPAPQTPTHPAAYTPVESGPSTFAPDRR
ncbi:acyltransferase [Streptomyces sp. RB6PN25]|uniref:Acyltransferase n=1 Tax=Streptomyces humicola TaxID=2953240 RepID=A0ABT1PS21_9ACTN|nr:acyltransferase [Streptomyces humicola]MCQ4079750.1 acyltransferase [Streptomyces humicola]